MSYELPDETILPKGFRYPDEFLKAIKLNLVNLDPWIIMNNEQSISRLEGLRKRYPDRVLVPFARRLDNDDIACFEPSRGAEVQIIHDFASPGYEQRYVFPDFWEWFKNAINQMINFD